MYLFFDTETTGLPRNWKAPLSDLSNWPRLVQLAYILYDATGKLLQTKNVIIKPEGFTIPEASSRIHGITTEKAEAEGYRLQSVLDQFYSLVHHSECLIAHNMSFDEKIVGAEFLRSGMINPVAGKRKICTMLSTTEYCGLQGPFGYKWPKLSELHYKLFNTHFDEAHNAAVDIAITAKCFWELKSKGLIRTQVVAG